MPSVISRTDLLRLRLYAQGLTPSGQTGIGVGPSPAQAAIDGVLGNLFALQGQDLPGTLWAIGQRATGVTIGDVRAAFNSGRYVRSWPFRGTLFAMAAADLPWILDLTGPRILAGAASRHKALEIDADTIARARDAVVTRIRSGEGALRPDMMAAFESAGVRTDGQRGYHLLWTLALEATIALGPFDGAQQAFVLVEDAVSSPRRLKGLDAVREIVARYLRAHGVASVADIAWWSQLAMRDIRVAIAELASSGVITDFTHDGVEFWANEDTVQSATSARIPTLLLLPGFDEYLLGHGKRGHALDPDYAELFVPGRNGVFKPTIVVGGRVVGTWSRTTTTREAIVALSPFDRPLTQTSLAAVRTEVTRYGRFLGVTGRLKEDKIGS